MVDIVWSGLPVVVSGVLLEAPDDGEFGRRQHEPIYDDPKIAKRVQLATRKLLTQWRLKSPGKG